MGQVAAIGVLTVTVGLSLARPWVGRVRIQPAGAALFGAAMMIAAGLLPVAPALEVLAFLAMPVITIVSLMTITIIASRAGFFRLLAWRMAADAGGDSRRLLRRIFVAGTVTGTVFTNDAAVLIFTPMVLELIEEVRQPSWTDAHRVPFYFAVLYVANVVGLLVISNPINIIVADWFDIGFVEYAAWMALPAVVSMVVTYVGLALFFRNQIPAGYDVPEPFEPPPQGRRFRILTAAVLALTLFGFFGEPWSGVPTGYVALSGAAALLIAYRTMTGESVRGVAAQVGWDAILFVVGIFLVASGLREAGVTDAIGSVLLWATGFGDQTANFVSGLVAALSSAFINNHPTASIMALSISDLPLDEARRQLMALSALIGGDLGPKMLPIGSLAALLWFRILRQRGVEISYWQYVKLGVPVTLAAAILSMAVLGLEYRLFG